jgi:predicted small metal-binding protein
MLKSPARFPQGVVPAADDGGSRPRSGKVTPMKSFACGDVVPGCDARFVCDTEDEILAAVAQHAREDHGLVTVPAELVDAVRGAIQPVLV